jgi:hypothetical protein
LVGLSRKSLTNVLRNHWSSSMSVLALMMIRSDSKCQEEFQTAALLSRRNRIGPIVFRSGECSGTHFVSPDTAEKILVQDLGMYVSR